MKIRRRVVRADDRTYRGQKMYNLEQLDPSNETWMYVDYTFADTVEEAYRTFNGEAAIEWEEELDG